MGVAEPRTGQNQHFRGCAEGSSGWEWEVNRITEES